MADEKREMAEAGNAVHEEQTQALVKEITSKKYADQPLDMGKLKAAVAQKVKGGDLQDHQAQILMQRAPLKHALDNSKLTRRPLQGRAYLKTHIPGVDQLFEFGIPVGTSMLVCGGPGSGKTIFCLQVAAQAAKRGKKCLYMTFEERPDRLRQHMEDFGWNAEAMEKNGKLVIKKFSTFDVARQVEAMLEKAKGELLIDMQPLIFPKDFIPDIVLIDSLSAIASAFVGKEENYRVYIEQLFTLLAESGSTSFLISETVNDASRLSRAGVEEFLADGVIALYAIRKGSVRENALEILKMRGSKFVKKIVAMQILPEQGIVVYPEQEVFGEI